MRELVAHTLLNAVLLGTALVFLLLMNAFDALVEVVLHTVALR